MAKLSREEALKKTRDFRDGGGDVKILEAKCLKCGSDVVCAYRDTGSVDYYDSFAHVCLNSNCDYLEQEEQFECNVGGRPIADPVICSFCRRTVLNTC